MSFQHVGYLHNWTQYYITQHISQVIDFKQLSHIIVYSASAFVKNFV